jgi:ABC-type transport system involved in multi-copper enzyme maturation permease subunit
MTGIFELARLTFIEAIRNRIAYGVLAFMILLLATAALVSSVTMGQTQMLILDMGLGGISIMGNLMAILFAIQSLQQERDSRALYVLLIRMAHRWQYVLGKFCGLAAVLALMVAIMCLLLAVSAYPFGHFSWVSYVQAGVATVFETWMTIAVAMLFAQTSSLFLGVLLTLAIDIAGRFTSVIHHFAGQFHSDLLQWIITGMYYALPNFEAINLRDQAGYIPSYSLERMLSLSAYSFSETAFLLALTVWVFSRKNLS